jgi:hypothetical protein
VLHLGPANCPSAEAMGGPYTGKKKKKKKLTL